MKINELKRAIRILESSVKNQGKVSQLNTKEIMLRRHMRNAIRELKQVLEYER